MKTGKNLRSTNRDTVSFVLFLITNPLFSTIIVKKTLILGTTSY